MAYAPISGSTFVDFAGNGITTQTIAELAYNITDVRLFNGSSDPGINLAIILDRNQDPTALLAGDWASRQQTLQQLNNTNSLWTTYGADPALYQTVHDALRSSAYDLTLLDAANSNYVSSAASRTIWLEIRTQADFQKLFHTDLYYSSSKGIWYWNGPLSLPQEWKVAGLWFDTATAPPPSNRAPGVSLLLQHGAQSIGNSGTSPDAPPQDVAGLYDYPLNGQSVQTATIGLIEPNTGTALKDDRTGSDFQHRLTEYLTKLHTGGTGTVSVQGANGQKYDANDAGERSLDVGVVAAINPNSNLVLYNGSGETDATGNAQSSVFTAIQSAIWDTVNNPAVTTNSWGDPQAMAPGSPFYQAYAQLYVDAALRNQTTLIALGDGGSGNQIGNGLVNVETNITSPYNILVGGSSLSVEGIAATDTTLASLVAQARAGDPGTIWPLIAGGLTSLPGTSPSDSWLIEVAWNEYAVTPDNTFVGGNGSDGDSYRVNNTTSGGVDTTQPVPWYQRQFGLTPTTVATAASPPLAGRGVPDVAALAGGNLFFLTPDPDMKDLTGEGGTSAATPFWAGLITQIDAVFQDQGLPQLGFMTDLLYLSAAVAPASFNDITQGNNQSSFTFGGADYGGLTPTGYGYYAGPGYDLVSGLGSPNGTVLARTLSAVAHEQMYFDSVPDVIVGGGSGWTSGARQSLLVQTMSAAAVTVGLTEGSQSSVFASPASAAFSWTSRVAGQSLQADFHPALAIMFDKQSQGALGQADLSFGEGLSVSINGAAAEPVQGALTSDFGFADFMTAQGAVRVARPVAVAETAGAQNDQVAIVRLRQDGQDSLSLTFYRVDDFTGAINGTQPGDAGYAALAQARAYQLMSGATAVAGPGYGNYGQTALTNVDAGDIIAMKLADITSGATFWGFSQANETVNGQPVGHLWNYGLNTWGFEDQSGGGDRDYNDLIVGIDFTSASGHGWLV